MIPTITDKGEAFGTLSVDEFKTFDAQIPSEQLKSIKKKSKLRSREGIIRDGRGLPLIDPNPDMTPIKAWGWLFDHGVLHRLSYDNIINAVYEFFLCEILRAYWEFEEWDDATEEETEVRHFMNRVFGFDDRESPIRGGFSGLIEAASLMFHYGFSDVERAFDWIDDFTYGEIGKEKTGRHIVPTKIQWIAPWSIKGDVIEDDEPVAIWQKTINNETQEPDGITSAPTWETGDQIIPYTNILHFAHRFVNGNMRGWAMSRPAKVWVDCKLGTVKRDNAAQDRLFGGIITVKETGDDKGRYRTISKVDSFRLRDTITAFSRGLTNRIGVPFGIEVKVEFPNFDAPNHINELKFYDHQILVACLCSLLGMDSANANRSLSDGITAIAYHLIERFADEIAAVINGNGYPWTGLVQQTIRANFANFKGRFPRLRAVGISMQDIEKETKTNAHATQFTLLTPDAKDEMRDRKRRRMRQGSEEQINKNRKEVATRNQQSKQGDQIKQADTKKQGDSGAAGEVSDKKDKKKTKKE